MHNLHLFLTTASSPKEACDNIENFILDWGDEDNWRTICGAFNVKTNELFVNDVTGRWIPSTSDSVQYFNNLIQNQINDMLKETVDFDTIICDDSYSGWVELITFAKRRKELTTIQDKEKFDLLEEDFFDYQYDEFGVTHYDYDSSNLENSYLVLIDMHS